MLPSHLNQNWTVMLWFKWDGNIYPVDHNNDNYEYLFAKESLYGARLLNGTVRYGFNVGKYNSNLYGNDSFYCPPNEWCHLAVTYDHQKEKLYKDSQLVFERNNTLDIGSNNNSLYVGGLPGDWEVGFGGLIDEFVVFNRSLTENEVNNIYGQEIIPDENTVLLLHFNNDSNFLENESFIHDFSGNNFNGKPVGHHYAIELWRDCNDLYFSGQLPAFPLIQKGIIYGTRGKLYAYNETTGEILWEKGVDKDYLNSLTIGELIFADNVIGSESLAYLDGVVFAYGREFYDGPFLNVCDISGQMGCDDFSDIIKNYTKPVIVGFNATNGDEVLRIDLVNKLNISNFDNTLLFDMIVNSNILYVRIGDYWVYPRYSTHPILGRKYQYLRSNKLAAIDLSNENLLWVVDFLYDSTLLAGEGASKYPIQHLVMSGNTLFVTLNDSVIGLNKNTGERVWQFDNPYSDSLRFSGLIIDDNTLFLGSGDGRIFAFEQGYDTPDISNIESSLPVSQVGNSYSNKITVMNGEGPFNWQIISGSLPSGLNLINDSNIISRIIINGTPTSAGDYNFTVRVTDKRGNFDEEQFNLRVLPASGLLSRDLKNGFDNYSGCVDSYIRGGSNKNKNFGKQNDTLVYENPYFYRGLMRFNNIFEREGGPIPDDAVIVNATLTLYKQDDKTHRDISFYQVLKNWSETEVTWNQAKNGVNWSEAGANETYTDRTEKLGSFSISCPFPFCGKAFYTVDITPVLEGYDRGLENNGLLLSKSEGEGSIFNFSSCDYINQTTGDISLRPKLTVNYKRTLIPIDNKPPEVELYMNPSIVLNGSTHTIYANIKEDYSIYNYSLKILNYSYSINTDVNLSCIPNPNNKNLLCETNRTFLPMYYATYYNASLELIVIDEYGFNSSISTLY